MTRWKASTIHLGLSALVLGVIAMLLVWRWYPPGFFHMAQADRLLVLLGGVDLVLGPLLTLVVYKQGKKTLKFDLSVIALLQLSALLYGLHAVWQSRPVYLVASEKAIDLVFANEIDGEVLARAPEDYRSLPAFGPRTVGMLVSADTNAAWAGLTGERIEVDPANYQPFSEIVPRLKANARPLGQLQSQLAPGARAELSRAAAATGVGERDVGALPLYSARGNAVMLVDLRSGGLLRPAAIEWPGTTASLQGTPK
jgi:hypothetical protein